MADVRTIRFHTTKEVLIWKCERGASVVVDSNQPYCTWQCMAEDVVQIQDDAVAMYKLPGPPKKVALYMDSKMLRYVFIPYNDEPPSTRNVYTRFVRFNGGLQHLFIPRCKAVLSTDGSTYTEDDVMMLNRGKLAIVARNVSIRRQPYVATSSTAAVLAATTMQQ